MPLGLTPRTRIAHPAGDLVNRSTVKGNHLALELVIARRPVGPHRRTCPRAEIPGRLREAKREAGGVPPWKAPSRLSAARLSPLVDAGSVRS